MVSRTNDVIVNFYTPYVFRSIGFGGTRVGLLASGMFLCFVYVLSCFF